MSEKTYTIATQMTNMTGECGVSPFGHRDIYNRLYEFWLKGDYCWNKRWFFCDLKVHFWDSFFEEIFKGKSYIK